MKSGMETIERKNIRMDRFMRGVFIAVGALVSVFLVILTGMILIRGFAQYKPSFLSPGRQGILNQLFNTIYTVFLSLLVSVPVGVGAGIYLSEYARAGKFLQALTISIESLSSLPSIVVGLFGYLVLIQLTGWKWNLLAGAIAISILSLPLITTETNDALRELPQEYREGSLALGAGKAQTIKKVLLPAALPRILTGIIMAAGRGFGEAAALLYTSGQSTVINWHRWYDLSSPTCPFNPMRSGETLALHIWVLRTEGSLVRDSAALASFSSAVLVLMTLLFSLLARKLSDHLQRRNQNGKD